MLHGNKAAPVSKAEFLQNSLRELIVVGEMEVFFMAIFKKYMFNQRIIIGLT